MEDLTVIQTDSAGNVHLDPTLTTLVGAASLEAYTDYANSNSPNYTPPNLNYGSRPFVFLKRFTGFDDVIWGTGKEERFGLIYQWSARSDTYLIAFRGTSSVYDMVLDLESAVTAEFRPWQDPGNFPAPVYVGDGFNKIYASKNQSMAASMQGQLFDDIVKLPTPPTTIIIPGHSLGCALASLFTLDLAVSQPQIAAINVNFASPRVGTESWQNTYNITYGLEDRTVRIRNSFDVVPKLPPEGYPFDFRHIGLMFPVSFGLKSYLHIDVPLIIDSWHSLLNYRYVVDRAVKNSPQVWTGEFQDQAYKKWEMVSYDPFTSSTDLETADAKQELALLKQN